MPLQYEPLDRNTSQIRLLRLHPSKKHPPKKHPPKKKRTAIDRLNSAPQSDQKPPQDLELIPECTLSVANLGEETTPFRFNALSYTWGPETPVRSILINHQLFPIRENLWHFLCIAIHKEEIFSAPLWVDQICVDQNSIAERNHQVRLMARVYSQASSVFIWLGLSTKLSGMAMDYLPGKSPTQIAKHINRGRKPFDFGGRGRCFIDLLNRPYWKRLWVAQEVLLARAPLIVCGKRTLSWHSIEPLFHTNVKHALSGKDVMEPLYSVITRGGSAAAIMQLRDRRQVEKLGLADLVTIFCLHECTDGRDLAFGLLGLLDTSHVSMKADYSLSPLRVVFETYMAIFLEVGPRKRELGFRSLLPFSRAVTRHHEGKDPPTWMQYGLYRVLYNLAKDGHLTIDQLTDCLESSDAREVEFSQEICSWFEQGPDLLDWWNNKLQDRKSFWQFYGEMQQKLERCHLWTAPSDLSGKWILETSWSRSKMLTESADSTSE